MSQRKLGTALGKNSGYINDLLTHRHVPSAEVLLDICDIFNITLNDLLYSRDLVRRTAEDVVSGAEARQVINWDDSAPSLGDVKNWAFSSGGRLDEWDWLKDYVELFDAPDPASMVPRPYHLGSLSIASQLMALEQPSDLLAVFQKFKSLIVANAVAEDHKRALGEGFTLDEDLEMTIQFQTGRIVSVRYDRLLLKVYDGSTARVLNFSRLKRKSELIDHKFSKIGALNESEMVLTRFRADRP